MSHNDKQLPEITPNIIRQWLDDLPRYGSVAIDGWCLTREHFEALCRFAIRSAPSAGETTSNAALRDAVVEAAKGWLTRYEVEVRDPSEEAPCKNLVAAIDALNAASPSPTPDSKNTQKDPKRE